MDLFSNHEVEQNVQELYRYMWIALSVMIFSSRINLLSCPKEVLIMMHAVSYGNGVRDTRKRALVLARLRLGAGFTNPTGPVKPPPSGSGLPDWFDRKPVETG